MKLAMLWKLKGLRTYSGNSKGMLVSVYAIIRQIEWSKNTTINLIGR
jgi:hypothetical protein